MVIVMLLGRYIKEIMFNELLGNLLPLSQLLIIFQDHHKEKSSTGEKNKDMKNVRI